MNPRLTLTRAELVAQRPAGATDDVHFPESLAASVIDQYTVEGDAILDPFAGFGTTTIVAIRMRRRAVAIELVPDRAAVIRRRLDAAGETGSLGRVIVGDARNVGALVAGPFDLCLTSPPYMSRVDHPENPLTGYRTLDGDYETYLRELESVFRQGVALLRVGGHLVVNVADPIVDGVVTPLADDVARSIARHLRLLRRVTLDWDELPSPALVNDCLLVFTKDAPDTP